MLVCICSADCRRLSNPGSCVSDTKCIGSKMEKIYIIGCDTFHLYIILTLQNQYYRVSVFLLTGIAFGR